jgi:hypothetical protein
MGERIRRMDAKQVEKILKNYGFQLIAQKGSHRKWRNIARTSKSLFLIIRAEICLWAPSEIFL